MFHVPEKYRTNRGRCGSTRADGNNGQFVIPSIRGTRAILCRASDGLGWEHVSVSIYCRTPTWAEMCRVKRLFWDTEDLVIQIHPPASDYIDNHKHCLHLWRASGRNDFCERPNAVLVGVPTP